VAALGIEKFHDPVVWPVMTDPLTIALITALPVAIAGGFFFLLQFRTRQRLARDLEALSEDMHLAENFARMGYWSRDADSTADTKWSAGLYEVFGQDPKTFKPSRENSRELFFQQDLPAVMALTDPNNTGFKGGEVEARIRCPDGRIKNVLVVTRYRFSKSGKLVGLFGVVADITARKAAERTVVEREEQLQRAISAMGAAIWDWDIPSDRMVAGPRFAEILGMDPQDFLPTMALHHQLCHPEDLSRVEESFRNHVRTGAPYDAEYRMRHTAGHYIWIHSRGRVVSYLEHRPVRAIGTVVEITERRAAAELLAKQAREAKLLHVGSMVAAEARSINEVLKGTIDLVCEAMGWPAGHAYTLTSPEASELIPTGIWNRNIPDHCAAFRETTAQSRFPRGVGLQGKIWESHQPFWLEDIDADRSISRGEIAAQCGLHSAVGFPVVVGGQLRAILEFFIDKPAAKDPDLLRVFGTLGLQIGGVVERQEAEDGLRRSRESLELAMQASQAGYFDINEGDGIAFWSPRTREILGMTDPAFRPTSSTLPQLVHPEDLPDFLIGLEEFRSRGVPIQVEVRARHAAGHYVWVHIRAVSQKDASGRHVRTIGFMRDVSLRREASRALADSEHKFRNLIEGSIQGVVVLRESKAVFCNQSYARMLGYETVNEVLDLESLAIHAPDDRAPGEDSMWKKALRRELDGKLLKHRMIDKRGRTRWFESVERMIQWEGEPARQLAVMDVTDQEHFEATLRASEERFRLIAENSSDVVLLTDENRIMRYISPAIVRLTGKKAEDLLGREVFELAPLQYRPTGAARERIMREAPLEASIWRMERADGSWFWAETVGAMVEGFAGPGLRIVSSTRDVTDRVEREAELNAARDRLKDQADDLTILAQNLEIERERAELANVAKSQFLAMMSHELRTPMTGVLGMADLLLMSKLTAEQNDLTKLLKRSARILLDLLNDILDFSKIEAGQLEIESIPFRISEVVGDVRDLFAPVASEKGVVLDTRLPGQYADAVLGDPKRLRQVISNLIGNAIKFTERGRIAVAFTERRMPEGGLVLKFEVTDTGIGIAAEDLARLFQPFVQADISTSRKYGGTGLGLAISKRLVEAMGGGIGVTSEPGNGSTFAFTIQVAEDKSALAQSPPSVRQRASGRAAVAAIAPPRRILLAEDNETSRFLITTMLTRMGHAVDAVENGAEAVAAAQNKNYDVVLMDMQMPVMDGPEATREIRTLTSDRAHMPIIALTADVIADHRAAYFDAGVDAIVGKPVDWAELTEEIERQLALSAKPARSRPAVRKKAPSLTKPAAAQNAVPATQAAILDEAALGTLADTLGENTLSNMLETFTANMLKYRDDLTVGLAAGDLTQVKRTAHALKGLCAQFGAPRVSGLAKFIEMDADSIGAAQAVMHDLADTIAATEQAFAARQARVNASAAAKARSG